MKFSARRRRFVLRERRRNTFDQIITVFPLPGGGYARAYATGQHTPVQGKAWYRSYAVGTSDRFPPTAETVKRLTTYSRPSLKRRGLVP